MNRIAALLRLESRLLLHRSAVGAILVLLAALLAGTFAVEQRRLDRERQSIETKREAMLTAWHEQHLKNAHTAVHFGLWVFRPPAPLQALEPGVSEHVGRVVFLEGHRRNPETLAPRDLAGASTSPTLSPGLLARSVGTLLFLILGVTIAGRDARAGIRLPAAGTTSRRPLAAARLLMLALLALAVLLPVAVTTLLLQGPFLAMLTWCAATALLWTTAAAAGLWLGELAGRRAGALPLALLGWAVLAFILPLLAPSLAQRIAPVSRADFDAVLKAQLTNAVDGHGASAANAAFMADLLKQYGVERREDLPINADGRLMQADAEARIGAHDKAIAQLRQTLDVQDRWINAFSVASPLLAHERLGTALAGTDRRHLQAYSDAVETYRRDWVRTLNLDMAKNTRTGDWETAARRDVFRSLAAAPGLPASGHGARASAVAPFAVILMFFALAVWAALRQGKPRGDRA
jgi:ABC-2 type transport system permease protein